MNYYDYQQPPMAPQGKGLAIASLVLGIISCIIGWFGYSAIFGLITGIVGLILWGLSKKKGFFGGLLTAGFVVSLIGTILSAIVFVACIACVGCAACGAASTGYYY